METQILLPLFQLHGIHDVLPKVQEYLDQFNKQLLQELKWKRKELTSQISNLWRQIEPNERFLDSNWTPHNDFIIDQCTCNMQTQSEKDEFVRILLIQVKDKIPPLILKREVLLKERDDIDMQISHLKH